ncbi:MAG: outer membrane protein transport protein [Vicingaceae bacterium]
MKKHSIFVACLFASLGAIAQNSIDALRFSRFDYAGTAKFTAMGGSFGALGGEASGFNLNPAGIGVYRSSEFTFSAGTIFTRAQTSYQNEIRSADNFNFIIPNISYVGSYKGDPNGWKNYSFGITYNRVNSFNTESELYGRTDGSTITNDYANTLNNNNASIVNVEAYGYPFGPSEAWQTYIVDTIGTINEFISAPLKYFASPEQRRQIETRGNQSETSFTFGGNYQDRLYLGGGISYQRLRFERDYTFTENYTYDPPAEADEFYLATNYEEKTSLISLGTGVNFKLGAIYRVNDALRIGGAIHSPTFYGINEEYTFDANSAFANGETFVADGTTSSYRYQLRTPMRYQASFAYLYLSRFSINLDYDYVDYSTARLDDARNYEFDYSASNEEINNNLVGTHNFRVGAEYNLQPFVIRGGYRYEQNPFATNLEFSPDETRQTISFGAGYRSKNYNVDFAFSRASLGITDPVYQTSTEAADIKQSRLNFIATVGWRW